MTRMTFLLLIHLLIGFNDAKAIPFAPRKALAPCLKGVQVVSRHYEVLTLMDGCCVSETCRPLSDAPMSPKPVWLISSLPWIYSMTAIIIGLALAVIAVAMGRRAISSHYKEHGSLEDGSPQPTSPLLRTTPNTLDYSQYQSTYASVHQTQTRREPRLGSKVPTAEPPKAPLVVGNHHAFAPNLTDSPRPQSTLQPLEISNPEQDISHRQTSAMAQLPNLNLGDSFPITIDDQIHTTPHHPVQLRRETQPENCAPTWSGRAQSALRTQLESCRRAETAPNFIIRSASRQLTLLRSLIGRASMQPIRRVDIRILGVGLSWDHVKDKALPGPAHDIQWLKTLFENHQYVRFSYLLNSDATYEGIHQRLEETYESATADTYLIVYCAGHGTENNSLQLYDSSSEPINEVVMNNWIVELRRKTGKHIPVYVVFDFCRASPVEPDTNLDRDIYIIWACSLLQEALDLDLSSEGEYGMYLPRSCFLMALILAVHDTSANPLFPSWRNFATRLKELVNVVRGGEYWQSKDRLPWLRCRCRACLGGDICANARNSEERHLFQVVSLSTLEENPDFAAVARFVASHFPLRIQRVVQHVSNNHWVMFFNPVRIAANRGSLKPRKPEYLRNNICVPPQITVRHMTVPIGLSRV